MSRRPFLLGGLSGVIAAVVMGWNLFGYPRLKEDEGITVFQTMSTLQGTGDQTMLSFGHGTPGYGHVFGGPLMLAGWERFLDLTANIGGLFNGLTGIERGRLLLVVLAVVQAPLLFFIVRRLTGRDLLAVSAAALFSLSPLEIWYGRWLEPDPFVAFWITVSLAFAVPPVRGKGNLLRPICCGLALGAAILCKELAVVAAPGIGLMFLGWPRGRRFLAAPLVVLATAILPGAFLLYLLHRHEFLASPGHPSYVGLMTTQAGRSHDGGFFNSGSHFWQVHDIWASLQPFFIILSGVSAIWLTAFGRTVARRGVGLVALGFWAFFASGLIVQDYYVASAVPAWVVATVIGLADFFERGFLQRRKWGFGVFAKASGLVLAFGLLLMGPAIPSDVLAFGAQDANVAANLTLWLRIHVPASDAVVNDGTDLLDLQHSALPGHNLVHACNYFTSTCIHDPDVTEVYVVDDAELAFLAPQDPPGAGALRGLALTGDVVWSADGLTDGNYFHVFRVTLPTQP